MKEERIYPLLIVSVGDSKKYRLNDNAENRRTVEALREDLKSYVEEKFPELSAKKYYSTLTVQEVQAEEAVTYLDIPDFRHDTPAHFKTYINEEVKQFLAQKEMNLDAPYSNVK